MINTDISQNSYLTHINSSSTNIIDLFKNQIHYFQDLIQKTIISIQKYKYFDILGPNELNNGIHKLEKIYKILSNNIDILNNNNNPNIDNITDNIDNIRTELNSIFKSYGTDNIHDLLNVVFGDDYLSTINWDNHKYSLIEKYFHPINFKTINWKRDRKNNSHEIIEKNKIIDDKIIVETSNNLECFDLCRTNDNFHVKVYGIKIAIHSEKHKKTLIIAGLIDDLLISCINNHFITNKITELFIEYNTNNDSSSNNCVNNKIIDRYIDSLTLKDFVVYSSNELIKKCQNHINQTLLIKQKNISEAVTDFMNTDLYSKRTTIIQLLLKSDEHEFQYLAYLLYDLLSNDDNGNIDSTEQTILFDALPWKVKIFFKDAMKQTIKYTNNLSNFDNSKIPMEQQICLLKASDSVKEKAMNKLKEIKGKNDDSGSKARNYLDALLKIPFGIYKEEWILTVMRDIKEIFKQLVENVYKLDDKFIIDSNEITNIKIKNTCSYIKSQYIININEKIIENLISNYTPDKRDELIINISNINNIIKKNNIKTNKLIHSGKKKIFMINQIKDFIITNNSNTNIIQELSSIKNIQKITIIDNVIENIKLIENKWNDINNYMNNVKDTLNIAVHGHDKAKIQIERIIGQWINGKQSGYCFGFEGPPGVGKTSFAKKGLAKCLTDKNGLARPFTFIAIGGQDNGSILSGHNYTYVGSEWGKIVDILIKNKCMNPIFFIDELDKVSKTEHGREIIGILTHLIDPTQNDSFQDKYFNGIELDLSKALFVFSYNDASLIDKILLDRIHRIKFEHLTLNDKLIITRTHILPEIYKNMGLENTINITDDNILFIIENYTNEPGIRKFKELLFEIIGDINLSCLKDYNTIELPINISNDDIKNKYLKDKHEILEKKIPIIPYVGVINGLWANSMGQGGIIPIEAKFFPSSSFMDLKLTGLQGDVMKESMTVAKTLATSLVENNIMREKVKKIEKSKIQGIHIHCPEGSVPKDGPSAGTAITCVLYSLLTDRKIKNTIAITGEINLQGCVTAIGGLELKILGGIKGGVKEFIYPTENIKDFKKFIDKYGDKDFVKDIKFHSVENIKEVLAIIFE